MTTDAVRAISNPPTAATCDRLAEAARPCLVILRHKAILPPMDEGVQQRMDDDLRAALAAYDAERADDEKPIDEAWLRLYALTQVDSEAHHWIVATNNSSIDVMYFPKDRTLRLYVSNLNADGKTQSLGGCNVVKVNPTRGDLKRLLAALGVPLRAKGGGRRVG